MHDRMQQSYAASSLLCWNMHVSHQVLKHRHETSSRGHEGRFYFCDDMKSCDSQEEIPLCIVNMVVALIDMYGERWLTWLQEVCNRDLPVPLLAFSEQSIFQVR